MNAKRKERRRFPRLFFAKNETVEGIFLINPAKRHPFLVTAPILNLSAGGLHFAIPKREGNDIAVGQRLTLVEIKGCEQLAFCADVKLEIKWIIDSHILNHFGLGCEFQTLPKKMVKRIQRFVGDEIEKRLHLDKKAEPARR